MLSCIKPRLKLAICLQVKIKTVFRGECSFIHLVYFLNFWVMLNWLVADLIISFRASSAQISSLDCTRFNHKYLGLGMGPKIGGTRIFTCCKKHPSSLWLQRVTVIRCAKYHPRHKIIDQLNKGPFQNAEMENNKT